MRIKMGTAILKIVRVSGETAQNRKSQERRGTPTFDSPPLGAGWKIKSNSSLV